MRVVRKINDESRYEETKSDAMVRDEYRIPSIDCLLMHARLKYLRRILINQPPGLVALLSLRPKGQPLPWIVQMYGDLKTLHRLVNLGADLSDPDTDAYRWFDYIVNPKNAWNEKVTWLHFTESVADKSKTKATADSVVLHFVCEECQTCFATPTQLKHHRRMKHGVRVRQRYFADANAKCMVCKTEYSSRLRLIAHLCNEKMTKYNKVSCWDAIQANPKEYAPLSEEEVAKLDALQHTKKRAKQG